MVVAYVLFFVAGLGFGYAAPGKLKWLPLAFPVALALITIARDGADGVLVVRLVIALIVTLVGIFAGVMLGGGDEQERRAEPGWR
jgi:hypothetical protein